MKSSRYELGEEREKTGLSANGLGCPDASTLNTKTGIYACVVAANDFIAAVGEGFKAFGEAVKSSKDYANVGGAIRAERLMYNDSSKWIKDVVANYVKEQRDFSQNGGPYSGNKVSVSGAAPYIVRCHRSDGSHID